MYDIKVRKYKGEFYLADNSGRIILKKLRADQVLDARKYRENWIKSLQKG